MRSVARILNRNIVDGVFGVEVECELVNGATFTLNTDLWEGTDDGSLRKNGVEFVLHHPLGVEETHAACAELFTALAGKTEESVRTSIHVHYNISSWGLLKLRRFLAVCYLLEDLLVQWCGETRVGNPFCLRTTDAGAYLSHTARCLSGIGERVGELQGTHHKYAAINVNAIAGYGSVEFRSFPGEYNMEKFSVWLKTIEAISKYCEKKRTLDSLLSVVKTGNHFKILSHVLGDELSQHYMIDAWPEALDRGIEHMYDFMVECMPMKVKETPQFYVFEEDDPILGALGG